MGAVVGAVASGRRRWPGQYTVPEVARQLGISERAVRLRIESGALAAVRDGRRWWVTLPGPGEAVVGGSRGGSEGGSGSGSRVGSAGGSTGGSAGGSVAEPVEAAYRVTPTEVERVVERTGAKYVADMRALFEQVGQLYEAQLATQAAALAAKDETIAEVRRRAAVAEAERDELRARLDVGTAAPVAPEAPTVLIVEADGRPSPTAPWRRLLQHLRGG